MLMRASYPLGYSFDDEHSLTASGWTVTGNYASLNIPDYTTATYKLTAIQPCTVYVYNNQGLVNTHVFTQAGQTATGNSGNRMAEVHIVY